MFEEILRIYQLNSKGAAKIVSMTSEELSRTLQIIMTNFTENKVDLANLWDFVQTDVISKEQFLGEIYLNLTNTSVLNFSVAQ